MSVRSNGITPEVIHGVMPPYHLSTDLLAGALRALAPWKLATAQARVAKRRAMHPARAAHSENPTRTPYGAGRRGTSVR